MIAVLLEGQKRGSGVMSSATAVRTPLQSCVGALGGFGLLLPSTERAPAAPANLREILQLGRTSYATLFVAMCASRARPEPGVFAWTPCPRTRLQPDLFELFFYAAGLLDVCASSGVQSAPRAALQLA